MPSPKSLINALQAHWEVVEHLVLLAREHAAFSPDQVLAVLARTAADRSEDAREGMLRQMLAADLLLALPRDTALQLHPMVLEFVRGLTREHELGLSAVLAARVEAVTQATARLTHGLQSRDFEQMRQAAYQLAELFRQVGQQLDQDRHAILEIAERAKASDANLPLARRYREVLSAYDEYVAPMAEMMDTGPGGTFYRHLEAAEQALDQAVDALSVQGTLYSDRQNLRHVAFRAKELRRLGREVLKHCSDTLLPLREEIRQHSGLSAAVSHLLGRIRKRGLVASLPGRVLPQWRRDQPRRIGLGSGVSLLMADAIDYVSAKVDFPEELDSSATPSFEQIDESEVMSALDRARPLPDLLCWLSEHYSDWSDSTLLRVYHLLLNRESVQVEASSESRQRALHTLRITYHPHALAKA